MIKEVECFLSDYSMSPIDTGKYSSISFLSSLLPGSEGSGIEGK